MGIERFAMVDRFVGAAARARLVEPQGPWAFESITYQIWPGT